MTHQSIYRRPRVVEYSQEALAQAVAELEANEQELAASYQAERQARFEARQAEMAAWRREQAQKREQARQEQEARREAYWEEFPHLAPWQWRKERGL